jgi:hypothetical protein
VLSASLDNGKAMETAARYSTEFGDGGAFEVAVDYIDTKDISDRFEEYGGSASVLLPGGLNFTGMYKNRSSDEGGPDGETYFGGIGYTLDKHHAQVGWGRSNDLANEGSEGNSYQVAYVYDWRDDIELFSSYRHLTLDNANFNNSAVDAQDIDYIYIGTRFKFL